MHYYQKNIGDYRSATAHLTLLEHGVYNWLLDTYYSSEQPLPLDERVLFRLTLARSDEEKQAVRDVLGEFFAQTDAGWIQTRCDVEIEKFRDKSDKARASINKRWNKPANDVPKKYERNTEDEKNLYERNTNQEPLTNNHKPITINHTPTTSQDSESLAVGEEIPDVCVKLRSLGVSIAVQRQNLDKITALVHRGAGIEHFSAGLAVAAEAGKGFAYSLGVVKGRLDDAAKPAQARASPSTKMTREDYAAVPDVSLGDAVRKNRALKTLKPNDGLTLEAV
jgi:uncharacterized protein YdaU (DUF1376 family)